MVIYFSVCKVCMLIKFGVINSGGIENFSLIDITKALKFAHRLELSIGKDRWRIADVILDKEL